MMPLSQMFIFSLVMSLMPGPTNIISASYGKKNGLMPSLGFIAGAAVGFSSLAITLGVGLIRAVEDFPQLMQFLKFVGSVYMIFLSACMVFYDEEAVLAGGIKGKFFDGIFIQWVNPRCWISALLAVSKFSSSQETLAVFVVIDLVVDCICIALWAYAGEQISRMLSSPAQQKVLNGTLGIALGLVAMHILAS